MNQQARLNYHALNPQFSVMVDACAGTGKTWLLVSRIIRLLMDNIAPNRILAITFTRKAAGEMQDRLQQWCRQLAFEDESWVKSFLIERGIGESEINHYVPKARGLYQLLMLQSGVSICTFDEWFLSLIRHAPLSSNIQYDVNPGIDRLALRHEAWVNILTQLAFNKNSSLEKLIKEKGTESIRRILFDAANYRVEWQLLNRHLRPQQLWTSEDNTHYHVSEPDKWFYDQYLISLLTSLTHQLSQLSNALRQAGLALSQMVAEQATITALLSWTFTQEGFGTPRQTLVNGLNAAQQNELINDWIDVMEKYREGYRYQLVSELNIRLYECVDEFIQELLRLKTVHNEADFSDISLWVYQLLCDPVEAPHWFYRLDARYQQVLIDEFQDTSPLQWHILKQWFSNAKEAESDLTLFLVGDPKQAIYRFRRSDSRIFEEARHLLLSQYKAQELTLSQSYRSHHNIINLVNRLFENRPDFPHVNHLPKFNATHGVTKLFLFEDAPDTAQQTPLVEQVALRHPLKQARQDENRNASEAFLVARNLLNAVGQREIITANGNKLLSFGDVLILARRRQTLLVFEETFRDHNIPFVSQQKGQLLFYLEIEDLLRLLKVLVYPADNISLAQTLKSPIFGFKDEDFLQFSITDSWWNQLSELTTFTKEFVLLKHWRDLSQRVPVHDLLETIIDESQLLLAYQSTLSAERFFQVRANIETFIEFALSWNSGRYPNLVRFLQEMEELREDEAQAPDQGALGSDGVNAVRLMTIHGAKGLESPMVWLVDHDGWQAKSKSNYWHVNWSPELPYPDYFVYMPEKKMLTKKQLAYIEQESLLLEREENNLLYVALTRAQSELYIVGAVEAKQTPWIKALVEIGQEFPDLISVEHVLL
ncbi:MAG: hypothetical protein B7Z60_01825 [Ferrovum sp. 37-45-19]|uniref:UvrD-helicase domain-containing protein n=1 Tax=Ferrovum sp. JA12 TaxID=1356299 RepID=UPI0007025CB1|nr:UvrD-helicase domain-containing protein [Ferrovum sp. JA12]OYV80746.1 MAG: hypothetical protein B7Z65_00710 [Ferrovum sp. 21-44-67]OYV95298.1 MAG: hypothetical protein B7Z60_01825 [Ferrovum sp. 37-45-19]OZB33683.1 MAG: hypothetical protein B7X47_02840 [Ferrovum sp. 34-44-207]HQT80806.1 UvrD-helicase domain-containing protein [Ferrovaceae bacterium]KRH79902.1 ATP-dependent helicase/nuclease subunit A [Ferrovum sp. JA12]